jgi:hypothetical protein
MRSLPPFGSTVHSNARASHESRPDGAPPGGRGSDAPRAVEEDRPLDMPLIDVAVLILDGGA